MSCSDIGIYLGYSLAFALVILGLFLVIRGLLDRRSRKQKNEGPKE